MRTISNRFYYATALIFAAEQSSGQMNKKHAISRIINQIRG
ncbi:hypothetical protein CSB69_1500 [Morganella morganii]|nr:hypothetical protein CSB69_1500 [Morganella morganii]